MGSLGTFIKHGKQIKFTLEGPRPCSQGNTKINESSKQHLLNLAPQFLVPTNMSERGSETFHFDFGPGRARAHASCNKFGPIQRARSRLPVRPLQTGPHKPDPHDTCGFKWHVSAINPQSGIWGFLQLQARSSFFFSIALQSQSITWGLCLFPLIFLNASLKVQIIVFI